MKVKKIISIIFYVIATFFLLLYGVVEILPHLSLSETGRLFLLCGSCLFLFVGGVLWSKCAENNKAMKIKNAINIVFWHKTDITNRKIIGKKLLPSFLFPI